MAYHSKALENIAKNSEMITEYYCDSDGHWMYLKEPWCWAGMGCGTLHEYTVADARQMMRSGIYRSDDPERTTVKFKMNTK